MFALAVSLFENLRAMFFQTKKIQSETLGEYLTEIRTSLGLSVLDVVERTGIQKKFIEQLEQGSLAQLPADVYVCGFLKKLGALYTIAPEVLIAQYKKERNIAAQLHGGA